MNFGWRHCRPVLLVAVWFFWCLISAVECLYGYRRCRYVPRLPNYSVQKGGALVVLQLLRRTWRFKDDVSDVWDTCVLKRKCLTKSLCYSFLMMTWRSENDSFVAKENFFWKWELENWSCIVCSLKIWWSKMEEFDCYQTAPRRSDWVQLRHFLGLNPRKKRRLVFSRLLLTTSLIWFLAGNAILSMIRRLRT